MAELSCYEDDTLQVHFVPFILPITLQSESSHIVSFWLVLQGVYRVRVEILNENENSPVFAEDTVQSLIISEVWHIHKNMDIHIYMDTQNIQD